jgi:2,4-dienoyl-CoA reductase (NADPH2)
MQQHTIHTPYVVGETHFYTTDICGEPVLFDTGPATDEGRDFLQRSVDLGRLKHVFITHCHVDHYGLARFIGENSDARIYIPRKDALKLRHHGMRLTHIEHELEGMGFERDYIRQFREVVDRNSIFPGVPEKFTIVEESPEPVRLGIQVIACPGHSQSDLVYKVGAQAVTGDILLRNIFQAPLLDIDLETFAGRFRNYEAYCASLMKMGELRDCEILPGHRHTVESLEGTILFYVGKLFERAQRLKKFPRSLPVRRLIDRLFGDVLNDPFVTFLKASEIAFMQDFLDDPLLLKASLEELGLFHQIRFAYAAVA